MKAAVVVVEEDTLAELINLDSDDENNSNNDAYAVFEYIKDI